VRQTLPYFNSIKKGLQFLESLSITESG